MVNMARPGVLRAITGMLRVHARVILPVALLVILGSALVGVLVALYAQLVATVGMAGLAPLVTSPESATAVTVAIIAPIVLIAVLAVLVWAGVVVEQSSAVLSERRVSLAGSAWRALKRSPRAAVVGLLVLLAVVLALALTPLLVLAGLVGLALTPLARRSRFSQRWPAIRTLVVAAIPLGAALWVLARVCLVLPSVWLAGSSIRAAFVDSAERSRGRELPLVVVVLVAGLLTVGVGQGLAFAASALGLGVWGDAGAQFLALVVTGPLLLAGLTTQYHSAGVVPPLPAMRRPAWRTRTAVAVVMALIVPVVVPASPQPAAAVGTTPASLTIVAGLDVLSSEYAVPVTAGVATTIRINVMRAGSAEGDQPSGGVTVTVDDIPVEGTFTLTGNPPTVSFDHVFTEGPHEIEVFYAGDATFAAGSAVGLVDAPVTTRLPTTTSFTVSPPSPSAAGTPLTANVTVDATDSDAVPQGSIAIMPSGGGDPLAEGDLVGGSVSLPFTLQPGMQAIRAYFTADAGFENSWDELTYIINPYPATVAVTTDPVSPVFGQSVAISATVTAGVTATGTVAFVARPASGPDIDLGGASLDEHGVATVTTDALAVGTYDLVATYGGSSAVAGATSPAASLTVGKSGVTVGVTSNIEFPSTGAMVQLTIDVDAAFPGAGTPSGTVVVKRDGTPVGAGVLGFDGTRTVDVAVGDAGDRTFTVEYSGDDSFLADEGELSLSVGKVATTTALFGDTSREAEYGEAQTWEGAVISAVGTPTGTVELWVGGGKVAEGALTDGRFSIVSDRIPVGSSLSRLAWVVYTGDGSHFGSDSLGSPVTLSMTKADPDPVLTVDPATPAIGATTTLHVDLGALGDGATGTVTFTVAGDDKPPVQVNDGVAELEILVTELSTIVEASYSGSSNLNGADATPVTVQAVPAVRLWATGPFVYGSTVALVATVDVGSATPDHGIRFSTTGITLADEVPIVDGEARLPVCIGDITVCPTGLRVNSGDTTITATYVAGPQNLEGVSAGLPYSMSFASTTTDLTLNTASTVPGSAVTFTATVTSESGAVPTGSVSFSANMGDGPDGPLIATFEQVPLVDGQAQLTVVVGSGPDNLRWPADEITAQYLPLGASFTGSSDTNPFAITRIPVTIGLFAFPPVAFEPTDVGVTLTHAGGSSEPFTGTATVTSDTGQTCVVHFPAQSSCPLTWEDAGDHSVTATYSGDVIYAPSSTAGPFDLTTGKATPTFNGSLDGTAVVGTDVVARWGVFDASSTGTVTVWGDGVLWCSDVPLATGECTGRFGPASATGSLVEVRIRYSGDATWIGAEVVLHTIVTGCATLDVRSTEPALGTVTVDTPPNCGSGGYLVGTTVTTTAHPIAPNLFTAWKAYGSSGLEVVSLVPTTSFVVGTDSTTWVRLASFERPCYPVTADVTGSGGIVVIPGTNCVSSGGVAGYTGGTAVAIYPRAAYNPATGEPDVFAFFGSVPGATIGPDRFGDESVALTVTGPVRVPVTFGPNCRTVTVDFAPAAPAGTSAVTTAPNCFSPAGDGYHPGTIVTVTADPGDPRLAIASWSLGGQPRPDLAAAREVRFLVGDTDAVLTASLVGCATLTVVLDSALDAKSNAIGSITPDLATNCPDGSDRYLDGATVTLTPRILVEGAVFRGWEGERLNFRAPDGTGPVPAAARTVVLTGDVTVNAGFYLDTVCSPLTILGDRGVMAFASDGCGPGAYFDTQKQQALRMGVEPSSLYQRQYRSTLRGSVLPDVSLDVYVSVRGDTSECFGGPMAREPGERSASSSYGPLTRGEKTCEIGGPIVVQVEACQTLTSSPRLHLSGDISGTTFGASDLPATFFAPGADGVIGTYEMAGFDWVQGVPIGLVGGQIEVVGQRSGPCKDAGNAFPANTDLALFATSPSPGITFVGFGDAPPAEQTQNPILTTTTATSRTLAVTADYVVECRQLGLGEGITVVEGARCPGTDPAANLFIYGTAVKVKAAAQLSDGRWTEAFRSGIVGGQIGSDEGGNLFAFAYMDSDKTVTADYPTSGQRLERGIIQGLKIVSGIAAIAAPIMLSWFFPPAGALFAYLGAAAGIANSIPGGREVGQIFELIDPTNITECAARWAFGNTGNPTGGANIGSQLSTANTIRKIYQAKDVLEPAGAVGIAAGVASFGYGLYAAGIGDTDFSPQTLEELADTKTMTGCLDQQWQAAGSNLSG